MPTTAREQIVPRPAASWDGRPARRERARGWIARVPFSLHQLLFRLAIAGVFLRPGLQKFWSWESTVALFADEYKVPVLAPALAAAMAATFEVSCSVLLIVGLATRVAALPLLAQIFVIQTFVYPNAWPEHLVWSSILLVLLTRGGGAASLDHLIDRWWGGRRASASC
jgi:putative oxidoreductase